jgi:DNA repair protein SbcC/Rad50
MRPLLLELEGFGAFRDHTVIDFRGVDLFALVGPTGAGKSTIVDAICFAFYGNVPRYDDQRLVGAAMTTGAAETKVRLRFALGDQEFVVARVLRRNAQGKVSTKEARLESATGTTLAGRESELRPVVEALLGLTFDDFTRCVVLPQGEFARFLHDKPADRQALLVRLLDLGLYGRVLQRANTLAQELDTQSRIVSARLDDLSADADVMLADVGVRLAALEAAAHVVDSARPDVEALDVGAATAGAEMQRLETMLVALGSIGRPSRFVDVAERRTKLAEQLAVAAASVQRAEAAVSSAVAACSEQPSVGELTSLIHLHERIARGVEMVASQEAELEQAESEVRAVADRRRAAELGHETVAAEMAALELAHRAHALAVELRPGEPCPVCEQTVQTLPLPVTPPGFDETRARLHAATEAVRATIRAAAEAQSKASEIRGRLVAGVDLLDELRLQVADRPDVERARVQLAEATRAAAQLTTARDMLGVARAELATREQHRTELDAASTTFVEQFHRQRDAVVSLDPPSPAPDVASAWSALETWAQQRIPMIDEQRTDAARRREEAAARLAARLDVVRDELIPCGIHLRGGSTATLDEAHSTIARTRTELEGEGRRLTAEIVRRGELMAAQADVLARRAVAADLGKYLKADRFQRWLVQATLAELAVAASIRLRELSAGRYTLELGDGAEFVVVDHEAADERRSVRTLSGGETFQASLALSLALADHLTSLSGRTARACESIFLDEGFGTLDAETLETVAGTIEALGSQGRMVGVVTHVRELAERVPVRYVVRRDARGGAAVERVTA